MWVRGLLGVTDETLRGMLCRWVLWVTDKM